MGASRLFAPVCLGGGILQVQVVLLSRRCVLRGDADAVNAFYLHLSFDMLLLELDGPCHGRHLKL